MKQFIRSLLARPRLTIRERADEAVALSTPERGFIVAYVMSEFPGVFDAALAELKSRPTGPEEVA